MAKKFFCDGCEELISSYTPSRCEYKVSVESDGKFFVNRSFDLCEGCAHALKREANPEKWTRPARPMPTQAA